MTRSLIDEDAVKEATKLMRVVLMASGSCTLDQIDRFADGMSRSVVDAYLRELSRVSQVRADLLLKYGRCVCNVESCVGMMCGPCSRRLPGLVCLCSSF